MQQKEIGKEIQEKGWAVIDLIDREPIERAKTALESELSRLLGRPMTLEAYQMDDDALHTDVQVKITRFFRENQFGPQVIASALPFFQELLGPDLCVQANPYLRITRPGKEQDNIGYHRDTFYGGSPYELSVLVPFVDVPEGAALRVLTGSHIHSEKLYPTEQVQSADVTKGSSKHQLGFLYAPKIMDPAIEKAMRPIPLRMGQALIFMLSTVHGSRLNTASCPRWSSDIRVMHAFAPVDLSARPDYYQLLSESAITHSAKAYFYANREERRDDVELELCDAASKR